ncbi:NAD(P)/FAD-dependent oxidoreductase [Quadrisphaera oryzae]|uniref:NAD(P)/FAD-dependent oxidoreductase n=1 Tax=Quadrisphaera TaxID=317661 RepID=UPI001C950B2E
MTLLSRRGPARTADVVVVGAGVVGAAVARSLSVGGARVVVVDRGEAAGGTSGSGEGNLLVSDKGPGAELAMAQRAVQLWPVLAAELREELRAGLPGGFPDLELEPKGGLVVATTEDGASALRAFAAAQRPAGVRATELDAAGARALEPALTPDVALAVHYPDDAQVQPVVATEALLASARHRGAVVLTGAQVTGPLLSGARAGARLAGVHTTRGDVAADAVVVAAGPWSGEVSALLGAPLPVLPRRGVVLVTTRQPHQVFRKVYDADYVGAVGSGDADLQTSTVVESTASGTILIGSSRERVGFDTALRVEVLRRLAAGALALFPGLAGVPVMRSYGGFRPYVPDHLPVAGPDPRLPGLWHATGHEGAGIGLAPATGELVADLLLGRAPVLDAAAFSVARPSLAAHLAGLPGAAA